MNEDNNIIDNDIKTPDDTLKFVPDAGGKLVEELKCENCDGTGWVGDQSPGYIGKCPDYNTEVHRCDCAASRFRGEVTGKSIDFREQLVEVMMNLHDTIVLERRKKEPYKDLFKSGTTFGGLLRALDDKLIQHVLDADDIIKVRHGTKLNDEQFEALLALPYLIKKAEDNIKECEGYACYADKAYRIVSQWFESLGEEAAND